MPFWGLTQQDGPWKSTRQDKRNASGSPGVVSGGGIGVGGTLHAGNGNWESTTSLYQQNGARPPPKMSVYAQRSVMMVDRTFYPKPRAGVSQQISIIAGGRYPQGEGLAKDHRGFQLGAAAAKVADERPEDLEQEDVKEESYEPEPIREMSFNGFASETHAHTEMDLDTENLDEEFIRELSDNSSPNNYIEREEATGTVEQALQAPKRFNNPMMYHPPKQGNVIGHAQYNNDGGPQNVLHFSGYETWYGRDIGPEPKYQPAPFQPPRTTLEIPASDSKAVIPRSYEDMDYEDMDVDEMAQVLKRRKSSSSSSGMSLDKKDTSQDLIEKKERKVIEKKERKGRDGSRKHEREEYENLRKKARPEKKQKTKGHRAKNGWKKRKPAQENKKETEGKSTGSKISAGAEARRRVKVLTKLFTRSKGLKTEAKIKKLLDEALADLKNRK